MYKNYVLSSIFATAKQINKQRDAISILRLND